MLKSAFPRLIRLFGVLLTIKSICSEAAVAEPNAVDRYNIADVIAAISENELATKSLSVKTSWTVTMPNPKAAGQVHVCKGTESSVFEADLPRGRVRCDVRGQTIVPGDEGTLQPVLALAVFDGSNAKVMSGGNVFVSGLITNQRHDLPWRFAPQEATTHFQGELISSLVKKYPASIVKTELVDGIDTIVLETSIGHYALDRRCRFHVAPSMNFAVVRRAIEAKLPEGKKWIEYSWTKCGNFSEVSPGFWLPSNAETKMVATSRENFLSDVSPPLLAQTSVQFTEWVVNPEVSDDLFNLDFEPGVYVTDRITGAHYQIAGVSEDSLKRQADKAKQLLGSSDTRRFMLILLNVAIVACLFVLIAAKRRATNHETSV